MGELFSFLKFEGLYKASSSSSSFFRRSLSVGPLSVLRVVGMYDFGAIVETPLRAKRGGEGGASFAGNASLSLIDEKGTAGQLCPAKELFKKIRRLQLNKKKSLTVHPLGRDAEVISVMAEGRSRNFFQMTMTNWPAYLERASLS
jgi:hypothetical protein